MDKNNKIDTAEVIARIKAKMNGEIEEKALTGLSYDFHKNAGEVQSPTSQKELPNVSLENVQLDDDRRASLNIDRASAQNSPNNTDLGAHLLSKEVENTTLNRCAPIGAIASDESGLLSTRHEHNALAPDIASHAEAVGAHSSLTPTEQEISLVSEVEDDDDDEEQKAAARVFNADLYEVRFDAYDNDQLAADKQKKGTRYRVALDIRSTPMKRMNDSTKYMLDFYNRPREINKRLENLGLADDPWYVVFDEIFTSFRNDKSVSFAIKPLKAFAKKLKRDGNRTISTPVPYSAAIFYQIAGEEPKVNFIWGVWNVEVTLDEEFKRTKESALWKKGRFVDQTRVHLDIDRKSKTKLHLVTSSDDI